MHVSRIPVHALLLEPLWDGHGPRHPPLGQQALAFPASIVEEQEAQLRPVARRGVRQRGAHQRTFPIPLEEHAARPHRLEQQLPLPPISEARPHRRLRHARQQRGIPRGVLPARPRLVPQRVRGDEAHHVLASLAVEHRQHRGRLERAVLVVLLPVQPRAELEQVAHGNAARGLVRRLHVLADGVIRRQRAMPHRHRRERVGHALRHGPAQVPLGRLEASRVALVHQAPSVDDEHSVRTDAVALLVLALQREGIVLEGLERLLTPSRQRSLGPVLRRPRVALGAGRHREPRHREHRHEQPQQSSRRGWARAPRDPPHSPRQHHRLHQRQQCCIREPPRGGARPDCAHQHQHLEPERHAQRHPRARAPGSQAAAQPPLRPHHRQRRQHQDNEQRGQGRQHRVWPRASPPTRPTRSARGTTTTATATFTIHRLPSPTGRAFRLSGGNPLVEELNTPAGCGEDMVRCLTIHAGAPASGASGISPTCVTMPRRGPREVSSSTSWLWDCAPWLWGGTWFTTHSSCLAGIRWRVWRSSPCSMAACPGCAGSSSLPRSRPPPCGCRAGSCSSPC